MQATLRNEIGLVGIGLHSGRPARLVLRPATSGGIRFRRTDISDRDNIVPARFDLVSDTTLCTRLSNAAGVSVSTVEHLVAALAGTGVGHLLVDIDGPEVPIMDGSAQRFVRAIQKAGLRRLPGCERAIKVLRTVKFAEGDVSCEIRPSERPSISFEIDFPDAAIGKQSQTLDLVNGSFVHELSDCRTFCRRADVEQMQALGLALGGSLDNAVVVEGSDVLNADGFRREDECVRHKMLDALGDLSLAGAPIIGAYAGHRAGHGATNRLLRRLMADRDAWQEITLSPSEAALLPGAEPRHLNLRAAV